MQLDRIDAHTHLGRWLDPGTDWMASDLAGRCDATWAAPDVDALLDDPRCAPVFAAAGELGLPVLIHTADPRPFFDPAVEGNPRLDELREHPEWSYANGGFPTHERLRRALLAVVERHRGTCFVAAHVAASADDLGWVGRALAGHPNLCIDLAAREDELAAHAGAARHLFLAHPDRVLFGTDDIPLDPTGYQRAFGFLDGLGLPDDVLAAIYAGNARRILGETERSSDAGTA